jgi:hypothetical protein
MKSWTDELRQAVRDYVHIHNLSQADVARRIQRSQQGLSQFLSGKNMFNEEALNALVAMVREDHPDYGAVPVGIAQNTSPTPKQTITCLTCGEQTPLHLEGRRLHFCASCGKELGKLCTTCGELNMPRATYCMACAATLDRPAPAPDNTKPRVKTKTRSIP